MMKNLAKPCNCDACGEPMQAGEPFRWHKGVKIVPSYARGSGSGILVKIETFRPAHLHDCHAARVAAQLSDLARDNIERACDMARKHGETEEWVASYRAELMTQASISD